jgi:hypothetical protein
LREEEDGEGVIATLLCTTAEKLGAFWECDCDRECPCSDPVPKSPSGLLGDVDAEGAPGVAPVGVRFPLMSLVSIMLMGRLLVCLMIGPRTKVTCDKSEESGASSGGEATM